MVEDAAAASGDFDEEAEKVQSQPPPPSPPPALYPDVELIEDGFGFMPESRIHKKKRRRSSGESKQVAVGEEASSCSTSTSLNIVRRYTWKTKNRMTVQVITYGATVTSIQVPDRNGEPDDILAGFETLEEYLSPKNPFFGCTIGRCANFIREGALRIKPSGKYFLLSLNKGYHHFNGGFLGFDKINWRSYVCGNKVIMSHVSEHLHEGYPGSLMTQITFEVTCDNTLKIDMQCSTSAPTIVNLSNSLFFNLAGHHAGPNDMLEHIVTINADKYTPADDFGIVLGKKEVVGGTAYDFRIPRMLRKMIPLIPLGGYDVNFCVTQATAQDLTFHARAIHPISGRVMELYSNQPGVQFYTGNWLPDPDRIYEEPCVEGEGSHEGTSSESEEGSKGEHEGKETDDESKTGKEGYGYVPLSGKQGTKYKKHGLFCFMPQNYPDAINNPNFPNAILNPGEVYNHKIQLKFGILLGRYT